MHIFLIPFFIIVVRHLTSISVTTDTFRPLLEINYDNREQPGSWEASAWRILRSLSQAKNCMLFCDPPPPFTKERRGRSECRSKNVSYERNIYMYIKHTTHTLKMNRIHRSRMRRDEERGCVYQVQEKHLLKNKKYFILTCRLKRKRKRATPESSVSEIVIKNEREDEKMMMKMLPVCVCVLDRCGERFTIH